MIFNSKNLVVFSAVASLGAAALYLGLAYLTFSSFARVGSMEQELLGVSSGENSTRELRRALSSTLEEREKLSAYIFNNDSLPKFIDGLETLGKNASVSLEVSSLGVESPKELLYHDRVFLNLVARGSLEGAYRFLAALELGPGTKITEIYLDEVEEVASKKVFWRLSVSLYVLKEKQL